jgi:hypothetical protein
MYNQKRFDLQYRRKDVQIWCKGGLTSLVREATIHNRADEFREAGFEDGDTIELTVQRAPERGKKTQDPEALIQELEKGLRVPGTSIGRSIIDTKLLEGVVELSEEERQRGHLLGWSVAVSDMAVGVGQTYYHKTLVGALELALQDKRGRNENDEVNEEG